MEAKEELLSRAHAALNRCDRSAIGYYEQLLRDHCDTSRDSWHWRKEVYVGYANAIITCDKREDEQAVPHDDVPLASAFEVYRQLMVHFSDVVDPRLMERVLRLATALLVDRVRRAKRIAKCLTDNSSNRSSNLQPRQTTAGHFNSCNNNNDLASRPRQGDNASDDELAVDRLLCGACDDLLKVPVTSSCGHTFCRECILTLRQCPRCDAAMFASSAEEDYCLEKDVFISRLVDKWWGAELKAEPNNDRARHYLSAGQLDQALRSANESLEQAPNGFTGLLIRSEVLCGLGQFQSSLADAENALRSRPTSAQAHYRRAGALSGLNLYEAALTSYCIGCASDRSTIPSSVRHEMAKLLHQLLLPGRGTPMGRHWTSHRLDGSDDRGQLVRSPLGASNGAEEPFRKRRKLSHSIRELVATLSDCEEDGSVEHFELRRRRRKRNRGGHRTEFQRIRHYSDPADQPPFSIGDKAIVMSALTEANLFVDEDEEQEEVKDHDAKVIMPMINIDDLLDRIFIEMEKECDAAVFVNKNLVEPSDFDCVLCYRPLWRPVVTPCGHTYCSICLDRCMDYRQQCPLCMAPIADALSLTKRNPTLFLESAMKRFIPESCGRRRRRLSQEENEPKVPIFICTAAFPNVPCPLLVSEPRYRLMLRQVIESGERQFGMTHLIGVPNANGRQQYSEYGTMLDIRDCVLLENGWSILSTVGSRRFRVVSRGERDGFDAAKVEFIGDMPVGKEKVEQVTTLHKEVFRKAICWFNSLPETYKTEIVKSFGRMPQPEDGWISITDGPAWTWWVIAILPLNQQLKGKIIAEINLEKRLKVIDKALITLQDRGGTRNGQKMRHAAGTATDAYAVNAEVVDAQTVDCCQRTGTGGSSSMLEDRPSPNQSTQFLL